MEDRYYLAALLQCRQIGSVRMRRLCAAVSSARAIWSMDVGHLRALGALPDALVEALVRHIHMHPDLPQEIAESCIRQDIELITIDDDLYPIILREIFDPPLVLYYRGSLVPDARRIGVVGARKFTAYGEAAAMEFSERIAAVGVTIVSGAASIRVRIAVRCAAAGRLLSSDVVSILPIRPRTDACSHRLWTRVGLSSPSMRRVRSRCPPFSPRATASSAGSLRGRSWLRRQNAVVL